MEKLNKVSELSEMLKQIPSFTPQANQVEMLRPIFEELIKMDKTTVEFFILDNIKTHFKISKEEAKKYISYLNRLRMQSLKKDRKANEYDLKYPLISDRDIDFSEALSAVSEIGIVNEETLKIVTAIVISSQLSLNPPLWLFIIGVPSSFKTELVGLFGLMPEVYTLDTLTENAFASGYVSPNGTDTQDLLPLLDNKCFIIKDLNTLFSMNVEMVKKILGDLTSIFDGKFQKFTATRGMIEYYSLFSMIGCVTPSIMIKHYNHATQLGPRFFFLQIPKLTEEEIQNGFDKSWSEINRKEKIAKARQLVSSYSTQLIPKIKSYKAEKEPKEIQNKINDVASLICKARGKAITKRETFKNDKGEDVEYYNITDWQVEDPWRILNQIKSLLRILSCINGANTITQKEIDTIKPIILSTMPVDRAEVLGILAIKCGLSAVQISKEIHKSSKTIRQTLKELEVLGIIDGYKDPEYLNSGKAPWFYFIREKFASILNAPIPSTESMTLLKSTNKAIELNDDEDDVDKK